MSYTIGDGMVALALAGGIVGYLYMKHKGQQQKIGIIHQERMAAMEKGIPLPEFPFERKQAPQQSDPNRVIPILGTVLFSLAVGTMIVLYLTLDADSRAMWVAPLPFSFLGIGFIALHLLKGKPGR